MKKDILFRNADLIKLALDDLVDQRSFFRKILRRERFFSRQIDISPQGQNGTQEEGEDITHPPYRSPSPVWLFSHSTLKTLFLQTPIGNSCLPDRQGFKPFPTRLLTLFG